MRPNTSLQPRRTTRRVTFLTLAVAALSAWLSFPLPPASAAKPRRAQAAAATTFTVNSPNDLSDGACDAAHCSLREAVGAANAETGTVNTVAFELHNLLLNASNEDALVAGGIPGWTEAVGQWGQAAGNGASNGDPVPFGGRVFFGPVAGNQPTAELTQDVDVSAYAPEIDSAGGQAFEFTAYVRSFPQTGAPEDLARVRVEYLDEAGVVLAAFDSGDIANATRWVPLNDTRTAPALTRKIRVRLTSTRATGTNNNGYYDALSLRAVGRTDQPLAALSTIGPTNTPTAWPSITDPVVIDGTTQPTFSNTPVVELVGQSDTAVASGFVITAGGTTVRGLAMSGFSANCLHVTSAGGNLIVGNHLGLDPTGTLRKGVPGGDHGILLNSSGNTVGGPSASERNVISGNTLDGIRITGAGLSANVVRGNYIGTDSTGELDIGNSRHGIFSDTGGGTTTVGGAGAGAGNVISGNASNGIQISAGSANVVQGNRIGTDASGALALGNDGHGVRIVSAPAFAAVNNTVGGTTGLTPGGPCAGACNLIAFNALDGVFVAAGAVNPNGNAVRGNSIHSNGGLGIDLGLEGVTANDYDDASTSPANETDADAGANTLQNFPDLASATSDGVSTIVSGTLATLAGTYTVEFFSQVGCDASGHGEGEVFLGSTTVTLASAGAQAFTATGLASVAPGQRITATATSSAGNTSEFSSCITDVGTADVRISNHEGTDPVPFGSNVEYTLRAYNDGPFAAHNVTVTDLLPAGLTFVGLSVEGDFDGAGCSYNSGSHTVTCSLGTMRVFDNTFDGPIKKGKVKITVNVTANQLGTFASAAIVDADEPDPDPSDNTGAASTTVLGVSSVEVTPGSVPGGASCQQALVKVTLSSTTPADAFVQLSDDLAATTNIPAASSPLMLRVPAGRSYATLLLQTVEVAAAQSGRLTAAFGVSTASGPLTVRPVGLKSLSVSPASVEGGGQSTGTLKLDCASASGVSVTLKTGKSGVAKFIDPDTSAVVYPLTLTLTNTNQATFTIQTFTVAAPTGVNLSATANGTLKNARLDVLPPP